MFNCNYIYFISIYRFIINYLNLAHNMHRKINYKKINEIHDGAKICGRQ